MRSAAVPDQAMFTSGSISVGNGAAAPGNIGLRLRPSHGRMDDAAGVVYHDELVVGPQQVGGVEQTRLQLLGQFRPNPAGAVPWRS